MTGSTGTGPRGVSAQGWRSQDTQGLQAGSGCGLFPVGTGSRQGAPANPPLLLEAGAQRAGSGLRSPPAAFWYTRNGCCEFAPPVSHWITVEEGGQVAIPKGCWWLSEVTGFLG